MRASEQDRPDVAAARAAWRAARGGWDAERLVFVDETRASTAMTRRTARGRKIKRVVCPVPQSHWKTTTFVAALRADGLTAPMVIDGAMTGGHFVAYVAQVLVPALRPGDVVVWDNLGCHKRAVGAAGATVRPLPAYSPDLNPIENAFSQLKALLRRAEERTVDGLWAFLGRALDAFSASECRNHLRTAGYTATANRKSL